jgi:hypothetical protein
MKGHVDLLQRERDAKLVDELVHKAIQLPTGDSKKSAEDAATWFQKKHHCDWKQCLPKKGLTV